MVKGDATLFTPSEGQVDIITFSYPLTVIPNWFLAIENALKLLKPGGVIGVSDFFVSRKYTNEGMKRHSWFTRSFWPIWFARNNVFLSQDHVPFLHQNIDLIQYKEKTHKIPYIPFSQMPYYIFIGRKPDRKANSVSGQKT